MENETVTPEQDSNEKTLAVVTHLIPLCLYVLPGLGLIFAPLIWWVIMKEKHPLIDLHGKEVLNFSISYFIYFLISGFLCVILVGFLLLAVLTIMFLIFIIIGTIKASSGDLYRYPLTIRFIK